jgi:hypothetical protein
MVDLNAHATGNGGKKPREAYSLPSLLYSEWAYNIADLVKRQNVPMPRKQRGETLRFF